jgi:hypothetical protein
MSRRSRLRSGRLGSRRNSHPRVVIPRRHWCSPVEARRRFDRRSRGRDLEATQKILPNRRSSSGTGWSAPALRGVRGGLALRTKLEPLPSSRRPGLSQRVLWTLYLSYSAAIRAKQPSPEGLPDLLFRPNRPRVRANPSSEAAMTTKTLRYGGDARESLQAGLDTLANAVKTTLGPAGRTHPDPRSASGRLLARAQHPPGAPDSLRTTTSCGHGAIRPLHVVLSRLRVARSTEGGEMVRASDPSGSRASDSAPVPAWAPHSGRAVPWAPESDPWPDRASVRCRSGAPERGQRPTDGSSLRPTPAIGRSSCPCSTPACVAKRDHPQTEHTHCRKSHDEGSKEHGPSPPVVVES